MKLSKKNVKKYVKCLLCVFKTIDNFFISFSHIWPDKYLALTVVKHGSRIMAVKSEKDTLQSYDRWTFSGQKLYLYKFYNWYFLARRTLGDKIASKSWSMIAKYVKRYSLAVCLKNSLTHKCYQIKKRNGINTYKYWQWKMRRNFPGWERLGDWDRYK